MKIGLVGPSYKQRSLPFDAQRTINLFPVFDQQGKEVAALYGTPGLNLFAVAGSGPIRGEFKSTNGRSFAVSGAALYEIDAAGVTTQRGMLRTSDGNVTIDENTSQMFVCDGDDGYLFTYASNSFAVVTDADFPSSGTITCIDGYIAANQNRTGRFYISAINDGASWDALDFATAESSPDVLKRVLRALGQLWLFGDKTTEIWTNTGDASFPFEKIAGADIEIGIMAAHTAATSGGNVFWAGSNNEGDGIVYRAQGFRPQRISTEAIELAIARATDKANMRGFAFQIEGHDYYFLTGGGLETSLVYDVTAGLWHERAYRNSEGNFEQHLASCSMFAFGKHLVGDRRNGNIYHMSMDAYSDAGDPIVRERIYTHLSNEAQRTRYNTLVIGVETGVGQQSGQGSDPKMTLFVSKDGARTWLGGFSGSIGRVGQYMRRVAFRRLGISEQMTFKIRISDPVKVAITGSYLS